jgi:hypothetical protein
VSSVTPLTTPSTHNTATDPIDTDPIDTDPIDTDPIDTDPIDTDNTTRLELTLIRLYHALVQAHVDNSRPFYPGEGAEDRAGCALSTLQGALVEILCDLADGHTTNVLERVQLHLLLYARRHELWDETRARAFMRDAFYRSATISLDDVTTHLATLHNLRADASLRRVAAYWWRRMNMDVVNLTLRNRVWTTANTEAPGNKPP